MTTSSRSELLALIVDPASAGDVVPTDCLPPPWIALDPRTARIDVSLARPAARPQAQCASDRRRPGDPSWRPDCSPAWTGRRSGHCTGPNPGASQLLLGQAPVHPRPACAPALRLSVPPPDAEEPRDRARLLARRLAGRETCAAAASSASRSAASQVSPRLASNFPPLESFDCAVAVLQPLSTTL